MIDDYTPTLSDTQLFSALNLDYPGLETVKALAQAGDFTAAKTALATYLRSRTNVNWYYDWHHPTTDVSYDQADRQHQHRGHVFLRRLHPHLSRRRH